MGAYTALHVGINAPQRCLSVVAAGCGWGSTPDAKQREAMKALAAETGKMFAEEGIKAAAEKYADAPMRHAQKHKDPRGHAEFARMLAEHSAEGHAQTMFNLQLKRPTLYEMEDKLKRFSVPLLVIVGDEDEPCIDGSVFLKRTAPTAGLLVIPRSGHNIPSEEPAQFNAALAELFAVGRSRPLARTQTKKLNWEDCDGPQAQRQDRAGDRRQRRHRQRHRARAAPRKASTSPSARAARSRSKPRLPRSARPPAARSSPSPPTCARTRTPRISSSRAPRRSGASTSWSTTRAPPPAA